MDASVNDSAAAAAGEGDHAGGRRRLRIGLGVLLFAVLAGAVWYEFRDGPPIAAPEPMTPPAHTPALTPAPTPPPAVSVAPPAPAPAPFPDAVPLLRRLETLTPQLFRLRAAEGLNAQSPLLLRTWAALSGAVVHLPGMPASDDSSIGADIVRLREALIRRDAARYAEVFAHFHADEQALLPNIGRPQVFP